MASHDIEAVRAAALDGRAQTVFYKLDQLEKLRSALVKESTSLQNAIIADTGVTSSEAKVEFALTLETLRTRYAEIDANDALEKEYRTANHEDSADRRLGAGIVSIQPISHTPLYSTIAPLAAAIAGGNVAIIQNKNSTRQVPEILKRSLKSVLDHDSIAFTSSDISLDQPSISVIQSGESGAHPSNQLVSPAKSVSIAFVDRNADFDAAATHLINARFSFGGRSPHAPDLVLVNEFSKKALLQSLVKASIAQANTTSSINTNGSLEKKSSSAQKDLQALISDLSNSHSARLIHQESLGAILDVPSRSPALLSKKTSLPALSIATVRSLDDAIDFLNSADPNQVYLAAYYFADAGSAKYLSQFVPAQATFVNHVPPEVLLGPAFPLGHPVDPADRYPTVLFEVARPAFIDAQRGAKGKKDDKAQVQLTLDKSVIGEGRERDAAVGQLVKFALRELPVKKRKKQLNAGFGFFEQAFVLHFGLLVLSTVAGVSGSAYWLAKGKGWRPWR